jgi:hypothetical protein
VKEPFVERDSKKKPGFNIGTTLSVKPVVGEVGIEIEVEGNKFPKPEGYEETPVKVKMPGSNFWSYVHDGSLRGKDNAEYVLSNPINFNEVDPALTELFKTLADYGSVIDESNRTSVHVHLNCQAFHLNRLTSFMALWFTFEEILTQWCGEHRVGNLFCLRSRDATAIISHLRKFLKSDCKYELSDHLHYAGLNAQALKKFGSLEVRTMRGVSDPNVIRDWVEILQRIYEYSERFPDPRDVCGIFSGYGPMDMFHSAFGPKVGTIRTGVNWTDEQIRASLFRGIRLAQDICYCRDWDLYKPQELKPDPFKRDAKKLAKKLISFDYEGEMIDEFLMPSNPQPFPDSAPTTGTTITGTTILQQWGNDLSIEPSQTFFYNNGQVHVSN